MQTNVLIIKNTFCVCVLILQRSLRTFGNNGGGNGRISGSGGRIRRGTVKALRVGANGKTIKTNSMSKVAT